MAPKLTNAGCKPSLPRPLPPAGRVIDLGALTVSIAHEVSQPLSGIITNSSACLRMLAGDAPDLEGARETLRRTLRDGRRAAEVIARLRGLFGNEAMRSELVDLNEVVREAVALLLEGLRRNRVVTRLEFAGRPPLITGDRVQLQQVVLNLVRNASDAMDDIEDRPRLLVVATRRDEDGRALVSVRDSGVGFAPHRADELFEAFHTTKSCGMGIGLFVSRSIVLRHRGRIWAALNEGPGATFSFSIPRERQE